jgi:hypothetical protein
MTRQRIQLDFSEGAYERLEFIKLRDGSPTSSVVIRNALRFYDWYLTKRDNGAKLQIVENDCVKEIEVLF